MAKNLVIVESPAKAKTIESFLGKDFSVKSSFGHIRDLPRSKMSIDIDNNFEPKYEIPKEKKKVVSELKKAAKNSSTVWLATDHDREGEAIAWHLEQALNLKGKTVNRITFREITKSAVTEAIKEPGKIDEHLVDAQQARRVLDRLVGYELSPVLWKKVQRGLSAGRVQSVAVRLIVEREREIENFTSSSNFKVSTELENSNQEAFQAELATKLESENEAVSFLKKLGSSKLTVANIDAKPGKRSPSAPFTTSSLQQEASNRLGYSVKRTMQLAQRLYEAGKITYMRTDSPNLSAQAISQAKRVITEKFGEEYSRHRQFKTKSASAQEAHEAIRPTNLSQEVAGADEAQKLYALIWQRTMASQMSEAETRKTIVYIASSENTEQLLAKGEIIEFDGFLAVYPKKQQTNILPDLSKNETIQLVSARAAEVFARPPARYTEASLVKKLEELGVGRPSTFAPTISTIQDREYVQKGRGEGVIREITVVELSDGRVKTKKEEEKTGADKNKLVPTDVGKIVNDFLTKYFTAVLDYRFTAHIEDDFDKIASGDTEWHSVIADFYKDFHPLIEKTENISRAEAAQAREVGVDPKTKKPIIARLGRYGPMLQKGVAEDDEKPVFAPLPDGASIDSVTLEEAIKMFDLPKELGTTKSGDKIVVNNGRFGPYLKVGSKNVSLKGYDPYSLTLQQALQAIEEHKDAQKKRNIAEFGNGLKILEGRYGPYITDGKTNAPVPKEMDPKKITEKEARTILTNRRSKKRKK